MPKPCTILLAEDEENDVMLLQLAIQMAGLTVNLIAVNDGEKAVQFLTGLPASTKPDDQPAVFLLDLKMPKLSGFDVLEWMAARPDLRSLPVVVLTSSFDDNDRRRAREAGASEYFVKPSTMDGLVQLIREIYMRYFGNLRPEDGE